MRKLLNEQGWTDVASLPAPITTQRNQPTCKAHGASAATRRDYIQANDLAVIAITSCNSDAQAGFDVHSPIAVQMSPKDFSPTVFALKKPRSFDWQRLKTRCTQRIDMERQHNGERPADEQEIKIYEQRELENSFRSHFARVENDLQAALLHKSLDVFWRLWSSATEEATVQACAHNSGEHRQYTGHGKATYTLRKHIASKVFQDHEQHATKATEQHRLKRQIHKIVQHVRKSKQAHRNAWPTDVRNTWENPARNEMWTQPT